MFKKKKLLLMFVGLMFFVSTAVITMVSAATPPQSLGYEGFLTNASGVAPSATYTVIFRIYDDLTGGTLLYSETQQVVVTSGFLSAPIGNGTRTGGALSISLLPFNQQYFVSVEIQQLVTGEMSPRTAIQSTSYSRTAYGLVASSSPPIGSVKGQLYYDTDDDSVYSYNGTVWNVLASSTTTISGATTTLTSNVTNINSSTTNLIASNTSITSTGTTTITSSTTT